MKRTRHAPAVTSLPQAPQEEANSRVRKYVITMSIRMVCFALMVLVTPYGWYTWVFGIAAAVLPYVAVVFANAVSSMDEPTAETPTQALTAPSAAHPERETPPVITIRESAPLPRDDDPERGPDSREPRR